MLQCLEGGGWMAGWGDPQSFLTLTADAHCSWKLDLDRESNKRTTMPKSATCGLAVQISMTVFTFAMSFLGIGGHCCAAG